MYRLFIYLILLFNGVFVFAQNPDTIWFEVPNGTEQVYNIHQNVPGFAATNGKHTLLQYDRLGNLLDSIHLEQGEEYLYGWLTRFDSVYTAQNSPLEEPQIALYNNHYKQINRFVIPSKLIGVGNYLWQQRGLAIWNNHLIMGRHPSGWAHYPRKVVDVPLMRFSLSEMPALGSDEAIPNPDYFGQELQAHATKGNSFLNSYQFLTTSEQLYVCNSVYPEVLVYNRNWELSDRISLTLPDSIMKHVVGELPRPDPKTMEIQTQYLEHLEVADIELDGNSGQLFLILAYMETDEFTPAFLEAVSNDKSSRLCYDYHIGRYSRQYFLVQVDLKSRTQSLRELDGPYFIAGASAGQLYLCSILNTRYNNEPRFMLRYNAGKPVGMH